MLERDVGLTRFLESGTPLDAEVSWEILCAVFHPQSPMHDGAVIVRKGRLAAAGCFLPLTHEPTVSRTLGSRHRAAIGISEESDAAVVVVSEELGRISLVHEGQILGKPDDAADATRRWQRMRGRSGVLHSGHCLTVTRAVRVLPPAVPAPSS